MAAQLFGNAGREHMEKYGTKPEHFAKEHNMLYSTKTDVFPNIVLKSVFGY